MSWTNALRDLRRCRWVASLGGFSNQRLLSLLEVTFEQLSSHIYPADSDRVRAAFATRAVLGAYETDFRIMIGEEVRWIAAREQGEDVGIVGRTMFRIFLDVTAANTQRKGMNFLPEK